MLEYIKQKHGRLEILSFEARLVYPPLSLSLYTYIYTYKVSIDGASFDFQFAESEPRFE